MANRGLVDRIDGRLEKLKKIYTKFYEGYADVDACF